MPYRSKGRMNSGSGFEQRGGYASSDKPVAELPRVPAGPAPGAPAHSLSNGGTARRS
jgi:hypothetical protein